MKVDDISDLTKIQSHNVDMLRWLKWATEGTPECTLREAAKNRSLIGPTSHSTRSEIIANTLTAYNTVLSERTKKWASTGEYTLGLNLGFHGRNINSIGLIHSFIKFQKSDLDNVIHARLQFYWNGYKCVIINMDIFVISVFLLQSFATGSYCGARVRTV